MPGGLYIEIPPDLKNTRVHSWNLAVQHQIGNSLGLSATYLGNRMMHVWGDVTGNPATLPAGAAATGPCTLKTTTGTQTFANCSQAPINLRRELSQIEPGDRGPHRVSRLRQRCRLAAVQRAAALGAAAGEERRQRDGQLHVIEVRGRDHEQHRRQPAQCRHRVHGAACRSSIRLPTRRPGSLSTRVLATTRATHIFNLTASAETPQFAGTTARRLASGWRLSGIFRATSGNALSITTGLDRSLDGVVPATQRVNAVLDNPYGDKTVNNWFNPAAFAQPAIGATGNSGRNAYLGPGSRTVDLSLVRSFGLPNMHRIEARVEAFNAFNWFRWAPATGSATRSPCFSDANFGRILSCGDPRILQFAVKYQF